MQEDLEGAEWWEAGFMNSGTASHKQGSALSDFGTYIHVALSCSGWTWAENFQYGGFMTPFIVL